MNVRENIFLHHLEITYFLLRKVYWICGFFTIEMSEKIRKSTFQVKISVYVERNFITEM